MDPGLVRCDDTGQKCAVTFDLTKKCHGGLNSNLFFLLPLITWEPTGGSHVTFSTEKLVSAEHTRLTNSDTFLSLTLVAVVDVLRCLGVTDIHVWFPSTLCTISATITKSTMPFKNKDPRNTTVSVCAFQFLVSVCWGHAGLHTEVDRRSERFLFLKRRHFH